MDAEEYSSSETLFIYLFLGTTEITGHNIEQMGKVKHGTGICDGSGDMQTWANLHT